MKTSSKAMQHSLLGGIRAKLIASFLIVALSPLLLLAFLNKQTTEKALTENAKQALSAAANETSNRIDAFIDANLDAVRVEAILPGLARYLSLTPKQRDNSPEMQLATETLIRLSRKDMLNVLSYSLLDLNGKNVLDTYTSDIGKDESGQDYFKKPMQTGLSFVSNMKRSPTIPDLVTLYFSSPVRNAKGNILGVLRVSYNATVVQQLVTRRGDYLLTLINNILDLSKIEAGKTTLNPSNFDLYRLLDDLEDMLNLQASNAGLKLIFQRDETVPRYICTDEVKLRQVLINLLSNAIKFTNEGRINLTVFHEEEDSTDVVTINFKISDTGVGISQAELPKLFQDFTQTQAGKESQEGTGLGLAISRKFVKLMGGDISVESELGKGTTFSFQIQAKPGQDINDEPIKTRQRVLGLAAGQPTYKILTVDDKEINCLLLIKLLEPLGFELKTASNGVEAIAIWEEWEPHLIFMDMRMPIMDGYEATKYIKSTTKGNATAIIALTASVLEEEKAIVLSAGCDDFMRKPFTEDQIFEALTKHLGVQYIYAEIQPILDINSENELISEDLTVMSQDWMNQLYQASIEGDSQAVMELITEIPDTEIYLIQFLTKAVRKFQFEQIIDLAEPLIIND
ncbi:MULTISPECIES: ATP-binding protein [Planktothrix]|uniref:ATP-binding protein n=2 Tax=Microcoleaceae TaxID=1892252 RepID=UPI001ED9C145|nr:MULTISPECIES: ATP-binding protein [Planktothrix]